MGGVTCRLGVVINRHWCDYLEVWLFIGVIINMWLFIGAVIWRCGNFIGVIINL